MTQEFDITVTETKRDAPGFWETVIDFLTPYIILVFVGMMLGAWPYRDEIEKQRQAYVAKKVAHYQAHPECRVCFPN